MSSLYSGRDRLNIEVRLKQVSAEASYKEVLVGTEVELYRDQEIVVLEPGPPRAVVEIADGISTSQEGGLLIRVKYEVRITTETSFDKQSALKAIRPVLHDISLLVGMLTKMIGLSALIIPPLVQEGRSRLGTVVIVGAEEKADDAL